MQVRKQQLELDMEQQTGSKLGKEYVKAVYSHPAYLTYVQTILCEMPGWMNHKPESRFLVEMSTTLDAQIQFSSVAQSCPTLCDPVDCSTPGFPVRHQLPELAQLMSIEVVMPSNHLILCHSLLLPSIFPYIRVFSDESIQVAKVLELQHQSFQ